MKEILKDRFEKAGDIKTYIACISTITFVLSCFFKILLENDLINKLNLIGESYDLKLEFLLFFFTLCVAFIFVRSLSQLLSALYSEATIEDFLSDSSCFAEYKIAQLIIPIILVLHAITVFNLENTPITSIDNGVELFTYLFVTSIAYSLFTYYITVIPLCFLFDYILEKLNNKKIFYKKSLHNEREVETNTSISIAKQKNIVEKDISLFINTSEFKNEFKSLNSSLAKLNQFISFFNIETVHIIYSKIDKLKKILMDFEQLQPLSKEKTQESISAMILDLKNCTDELINSHDEYLLQEINKQKELFYSKN